MTQFQRSWSAALPRVALSTASRVRASARRGLAAGEAPSLIKPPETLGAETWAAGTLTRPRFARPRTGTRTDTSANSVPGQLPCCRG